MSSVDSGLVNTPTLPLISTEQPEGTLASPFSMLARAKPHQPEREQRMGEMCWRTELLCPASLPTSSWPPSITGYFHAALNKLYTKTTWRRALTLALNTSGYKVSRQGHTFTALHSSASNLCSLPGEIRKRRQGTMGGLKSKSKVLRSGICFATAGQKTS